MPTDFLLRPALSALEREQACDIRRSVLCGELHLGREAARDDADADAVMVLAWAGEKPVGTGRLMERGGLVLVEHLCVLPNYRRQGLGRLMVEHLEELCRKSGAGAMAAVAPLSARAFFRATGFIVEKEDADVALLVRKL